MPASHITDGAVDGSEDPRTGNAPLVPPAGIPGTQGGTAGMLGAWPKWHPNPVDVGEARWRRLFAPEKLGGGGCLVMSEALSAAGARKLLRHPWVAVESP